MRLRWRERDGRVEAEQRGAFKPTSMVVRRRSDEHGVAVAVDPGGLNWHTGERTPARVFVLLLDDEAPLAVSVPGGSPS
jgi:hypothetical protein